MQDLFNAGLRGYLPHSIQGLLTESTILHETWLSQIRSVWSGDACSTRLHHVSYSVCT